MALRSAIRAGKLPNEAFPAGMSMRIDDRTVHEPDALVRCRPPLGDPPLRHPPSPRGGLRPDPPRRAVPVAELLPASP